MNFTREPIIETIISAKDGHKLSIKSTKLVAQEEYLVDAIEVVSFGGTYFYRSQERPKAFFLPANDFEVLEVRETRLIVKQPHIEKVKIGGGKESSKTHKSAEAKHEPKQDDKPLEAGSTEQAAEKKGDQPHEKKRGRRSKKTDQRDSKKQRGNQEKPQEDKAVNETPQEAPVKTVFSHLLQPPGNLITESLKKYKRADGFYPPTDSVADVSPKQVTESLSQPSIMEDASKNGEQWDRYIQEPLLANPFEPENSVEISYTLTEASSDKDFDYPEDRE